MLFGLLAEYRGIAGVGQIGWKLHEFKRTRQR